MERLADLIRQTLATFLLTEARDPRFSRVVITRVKMTGDLQLARVFYVLQEKETEDKEISRGLQSASGFLRRALAERLNLRYSPRLQFLFDEDLAQTRRIEEILREIGPTPSSESE